jgi:hypothetical protein
VDDLAGGGHELMEQVVQFHHPDVDPCTDLVPRGRTTGALGDRCAAGVCE